MLKIFFLPTHSCELRQYAYLRLSKVFKCECIFFLLIPVKSFFDKRTTSRKKCQKVEKILHSLDFNTFSVACNQRKPILTYWRWRTSKYCPKLNENKGYWTYDIRQNDSDGKFDSFDFCSRNVLGSVRSWPNHFWWWSDHLFRRGGINVDTSAFIDCFHGYIFLFL